MKVFRFLPYAGITFISLLLSLGLACINISCKVDSVSAENSVSYFSVSGIVSYKNLPYNAIKVSIGNKSAITDTSGYFMIDSITSGVNRFVIASDSLIALDSVLTNNHNLFLKKDISYNLSQSSGNLALNGTVTINGLPLSECEVQLNNVSSICNSDGFFEFLNVIVGLYKFRILYNHTQLLDTILEIKNSRTILIDLPKALSNKLPKYTLQGLVTCNDVPIMGALITCNDIVTQSDSNGAYSLHGIPYGRHSIQIDRQPFDKIDTTLDIVGSKVVNINLIDNLVNQETYFPVKIGRTWRFNYESEYHTYGSPTLRDYKIITWKVISVEGTKNEITYKILETVCDTTSLKIDRVTALVNIYNSDSVAFSNSFIRSGQGTLPPKIPLGSSSSPLYLSYASGAGQGFSERVDFTKGVGLTNFGSGYYSHSAQIYTKYIYVGTDITLPPPFNQNY